MMRWIWVAALALAAGDATAQPYLGSELGFTLVPNLRLVATDNDWGTRCDLLINPNRLETGTECDTPPPPTEWTNDSGSGQGIAAGLAAGYRFGRFRAEVEYRYRATSHNDFAPTQIGDVVTAQKADQELERAVGGGGDFTMHGLFTNLAVDLGAARQPLNTYVGVGAGVQRVAIDYLSLWKRNPDPARIATFEDAALRAKLAGTTTLGAAGLDDTMFSVQILGGVDYRVADGLTIGNRIRYATGLGAFLSEPREWDQLRSHDSSVGRGSRILYTVETRDTSALTVILILRYDL
ncbi:MAG: hypothetical protein F4151_13470 [Gammaproteobacteria bacterium]|nr:hypothetical protein [Gammaproteobacteria bacterium]